MFTSLLLSWLFGALHNSYRNLFVLNPFQPMFSFPEPAGFTISFNKLLCIRVHEDSAQSRVNIDKALEGADVSEVHGVSSGVFWDRLDHSNIPCVLFFSTELRENNPPLVSSLSLAFL